MRDISTKSDLLLLLLLFIIIIIIKFVHEVLHKTNKSNKSKKNTIGYSVQPDLTVSILSLVGLNMHCTPKSDVVDNGEFCTKNPTSNNTALYIWWIWRRVAYGIPALLWPAYWNHTASTTDDCHRQKQFCCRQTRFLGSKYHTRASLRHPAGGA